MTFRETWAAIKHHPNLAAGAVFLGGAVLVYLYYSTGAKKPAAADPQTAYIQGQLISEATQAQYGAQVAAIQSQENTVATQVKGNVAINADRNATELAIAGLSAGVQTKQIGAVQTIDLAQIGAQRELGLATVGAGVTHDRLLFDWMNNASVLAANVQNTATVVSGQTATNLAYFANLTATKTAEFQADSSMYAAGAQAFASTHADIIAQQLAQIQAAKERINA